MSDFTTSKERSSSLPDETLYQEAQNLESASQQPSADGDYKNNKAEDGKAGSADVAIAEKPLPTIGQLMRSTAQSVQRFYRAQLGHSPSRVTCHVAADKLIIWAENSVTSIEKLLYQFDPEQLASVRTVVDDVCRQQLIDIIEQTLGVKVVTLVSDTCYEQECTGLIAALSEKPKVRSNRNAADY